VRLKTKEEIKYLVKIEDMVENGEKLLRTAHDNGTNTVGERLFGIDISKHTREEVQTTGNQFLLFFGSAVGKNMLQQIVQVVGDGLQQLEYRLLRQVG